MCYLNESYSPCKTQSLTNRTRNRYEEKKIGSALDVLENLLCCGSNKDLSLRNGEDLEIRRQSSIKGRPRIFSFVFKVALFQIGHFIILCLASGHLASKLPSYSYHR